MQERNTRTRVRAVLISAVLASALACQAEDQTADAGYVTRDSSGVAIVVNDRPLLSDATPLHFDTAMGPGIGADELAPESHFRFLHGSTVLSNGNIVLAMDKDVRMFDANGKFMKIIAREGSGPGEVRSVTSLLRLANDTILIAQSVVEGGRRIALYSSGGAFIREEHPDMQAFSKLGPWSECQSRVFHNRAWLGCKSDPTIPETATNRKNRMVANGFTSPGPGHLRRLERWHLIPASLDKSVPIGIEGGIEQYGVQTKSGGTNFVVHPFYSRSYIASGGNPYRISTITNPQYEIQVWSDKGTLERIIRRRDGRRAPTSEELAAAKDQMRERESGFGQNVADINEIIDAVPTPDSLPAASGLLMSEDGQIAVRRGMTTASDSVRYDIFSPNGRWTRSIALPKGTFILELGTRQMLVVRYNEDDVPSVKVYRSAALSDAPVGDKPKP